MKVTMRRRVLTKKRRRRLSRRWTPAMTRGLSGRLRLERSLVLVRLHGVSEGRRSTCQGSTSRTRISS